jgi:hypothetical protein
MRFTQQYTTQHTFNISEPIFAGLSVTMAPAFSSAMTLSDAAPNHARYQQMLENWEDIIRLCHQK